MKNIIDAGITKHHLATIKKLRAKIEKIEKGLAKTERKWRDERDLRIVAEENQCSCDKTEDTPMMGNNAAGFPIKNKSWHRRQMK